MKKIITLFISLFMTFSLIACGGSDTKEEMKVEDFYGSWKVVKGITDGKEYTVEQLEEANNYNLSEAYVVISSSGSIDIYEGSKDKWSNGTWTQEDDCLKAGGVTITLENNQLRVSSDETYICDKFSDSQNKEDIPVKKQEEVVTPKTGVSDDFKATMDAYEAFFDEYVAFMQTYQQSDDPSSLMMEYLNFMSKYADTMNKLNAMENQDLTNEELQYYTEVMLRINQKLLSVV